MWSKYNKESAEAYMKWERRSMIVGVRGTMDYSKRGYAFHKWIDESARNAAATNLVEHFGPGSSAFWVENSAVGDKINLMDKALNWGMLVQT